MSLVGNLADLGLGDIFQIVSLSRRSGTLQLTTAAESGEIVFRSGKVVAAYRTNMTESIGEALLRANVITPTLYQDMLAAQAGGLKGAALFTSFKVDKAGLDEALEGLLTRMIYTMFDWEDGSFSFVLEDDPDVWRGFGLESARAVAESGLNPQFLAIEGARLHDERGKEDSLKTFLALGDGAAKSRAQPAVERSRTEPVAEEVSKLSSIAPLTVAHLSERAVPSDEKVIPFPAARVRRDAPAFEPTPFHGAAAPALNKPATPAAESQPLEGVPAPAASSETISTGQSLLLIDDDPVLLKRVQTNLGSMFNTITTVETVQEALTTLQQDPSGWVVASDLIIARSDGRGILGGIEILEKVRERWPELPVVLFTDYQNQEAEGRARALGVQGFLNKPRKAQLQGPAADDATGPLQNFLTELKKALAPLHGVAQPATEAASAVPVSAQNSVLDQLHAAPSDVAKVRPAPATDFGSIDWRTDLQKEIEELTSPLISDLPPPVLSAGELGILRSMLAELVDPGSRDTVTLLVLRFASHVMERAALFLATRRAYVGLGGFSMEDDSEKFVARVRRISVPVEQDSIFTDVTRLRTMIRAPLQKTDGNRQLISGLGGPWPSENTIVAPLVSGNRVAAILYGDNPSGKLLATTEGLDIFLQQAGLAMDRALLERKLEETQKKGDRSE